MWVVGFVCGPGFCVDMDTYAYTHTYTPHTNPPIRQAKELSQQIAVKAALKKKASGKEMTALLKRLELKGQPVWGLSVSERDLVKEARRLFNKC